MGIILVGCIVLFAIIYFSVRLAINPLLNDSDKIIIDNQDFEFVKLRDMGVFNNEEIEEVIELYKNKSVREKEHRQYKKYLKVLTDLKEMGYLNEEIYSSKLAKLNEFFKVE